MARDSQQHRFDHGRGVGGALARDVVRAAMRDRGEQDRRADGQRRGSVLCQKLRGDMALVVQHDDEGVDAPDVKHRICAERPACSDAARSHRVDRRLDDLDLLASEQSTLAGMGIETADRDLGLRHAQTLERAVGGSITRATLSRVTISIACRTLWCSVA